MQARVDAEGLKATLGRYNQFAAQGKDEEFQSDPEFLHAYQGEKIYLVEQRNRFATTLGGLTATARLNLQTETGAEIPNIWAAGEVVGGANGHDSMPSMMNTWSIASGYAAANNVIQFLDRN